MPRRLFFASWILGVPLAAAAAAPQAAQPAVELRLYAAASLRDVVGELAPALEGATGVRLVTNFAASSDLARQIVAAHRADLFFSADEAWMDHLAAAGLVDAPSRGSPIGNRLAVVVPFDSALTIARAADLAAPAVRRLALANPEAVPAGRYARAWLEQAGVWEGLAPRVVPALDVRAALAAVASGGVDAGVVYTTDAASTARVRVALEVPAAEAPVIRYALAALAGRPQLAVARAAVTWLTGADAARIFARHGFVVGPPGEGGEGR
jgi:molybdate transport system substrate-binding protein